MYNDGLIGNQTFTGITLMIPTGQAIRVYYISAWSTVSSANLSLYNTRLNTATNGATRYLTIPASSQGFINEEWSCGVYFPNGVYINTGCAGTISGVVGYNTVKA